MSEFQKVVTKSAKRLTRRLKRIDGIMGMELEQRDDEIMRLRQMNDALAAALDYAKAEIARLSLDAAIDHAMNEDKS